MRRRTALIAAAGLAGTLAAVTPALAASGSTAPRFSSAVMLKHYGGGEPSLALDPRNSRNVYVTAPQSIPTGLNIVLGGNATSGVGFWASYDGGRTFPVARNIGSSFGGGDSDVEVGSDGTIYVADLEAAGAAICTSHDHGKTFTSGNALSAADSCQKVTTNQQDLADCDTICEAVIENLEEKRKMYASLDAVVKKDAIFASNTSSISITEMMTATSRPERFVGLHS